MISYCVLLRMMLRIICVEIVLKEAISNMVVVMFLPFKIQHDQAKTLELQTSIIAELLCLLNFNERVHAVLH